ncbi:hypothetical protein AMTRI_Chr09g35880 [Amborella trichopoda]
MAIRRFGSGLMCTPSHATWQSSDLVHGLMALRHSHALIRQFVDTPALSPLLSAYLLPGSTGTLACLPSQSRDLLLVLMSSPAHSSSESDNFLPLFMVPRHIHAAIRRSPY